jgi:lipopolysaccharide/colanic/teichoic acid biosynthesis glycosyltransferase
MSDSENAVSVVSAQNRDILPLSLHHAHQQRRIKWSPEIKMFVEWFCALGLVILFAPLLVFLALIVKVSSKGPAVYKQSRVGYRGKIFQIYKIRTMVHNAESETGPVWATRDDTRITSFGAFLRATHLDELPQLFNVLKMEMSLIGPRPERPEIESQIAEKFSVFRNRLAVRPGITGLSQMLLPADDPADRVLECVRRKLEYDLYYVRHVSLLLDLRIYIGTVCRQIALTMESACRVLTNSCRTAIQVDRDMQVSFDIEQEQ